jgi:hypothetical protein
MNEASNDPFLMRHLKGRKTGISSINMGLYDFLKYTTTIKYSGYQDVIDELCYEEKVLSEEELFDSVLTNLKEVDTKIN